MTIDLRKGFGEFEEYHAFKFPAGEIHVKIPHFSITTDIISDLSSSDGIILLMLVVDTIKKQFKRSIINLYIPYMPYQQADRDFGPTECFSLKTISNLINSMDLDKIEIFDPHSDVTPSLINNSSVIDNSEFIKNVLTTINQKDLIILSPDAGAYKKIFSLCDKIGFKGEIQCCSKSREHETGNKIIIVPEFNSIKPVLIIDDICLAGGTFLGIKKQINNPTYLAVSHGVFNKGINHLLNEFDMIFTTNSICKFESVNGKIFKVYDIFN